MTDHLMGDTTEYLMGGMTDHLICGWEWCSRYG